MSLKPKVSIITVCYNARDTIADTIRSVIKQDYPNIEYLVIDGDSNDGSQTIISKYAGLLGGYISEPDQGMYDALNKGIGMASGEIIGMLNADDFYKDEKVVSDVVNVMRSGSTSSAGISTPFDEVYPERRRRAQDKPLNVTATEDKEVDAAYADLDYVKAEDTDKVVRKWKSGKYKREKFKQGWMPPHPTFFLRKEAYEKYGGFNLDFKSAADYELMLRMLYKHELKAAYLPRTIVKMRVGGMSNASLLNRLKANQEDRMAWKVNGLKPGPFTLMFKPLRKILQYF